MRAITLLLLFALPVAALAAQPPSPMPNATAKPESARTDPAQAELLANYLRELIAKKIPDPLTKSNDGWGRQTAVTVVRRQREGLRIWTEPVREKRNDGMWRRVEVRIPEPEKIAVTVMELVQEENGKFHATVALACERVDVRFQQQLWRNGLRLYSGETRAHCQAALSLKAEITVKREPSKGVATFLQIPDVKITIQATEAKLYYDKLVVDHTAGLDGNAAKVVGDVILKSVKAVKPDLESDLLLKANAAIVKAAGTREVTVKLDKLLASKPKP